MLYLTWISSAPVASRLRGIVFKDTVSEKSCPLIHQVSPNTKILELLLFSFHLVFGCTHKFSKHLSNNFILEKE